MEVEEETVDLNEKSENVDSKENDMDLFGEDSDDNNSKCSHREDISQVKNGNENEIPSPSKSSKPSGNDLDDLSGENDNENEIPSPNKTSKPSGNDLDDLSGENDNENEVPSPSKSLKPSGNDLDDLFGEMDDDDAQVASANIEKQTTQSILNIPEVSSLVDSASIFSIRTPNFMKFQPSEFDKNTYESTSETLKFSKASSIIRWRNKVDESGNVMRDSITKKLMRESNARLVKWSDNTYQIFVGDKIYNVVVSNLANCYSFKQQVSVPKDDNLTESTSSSNDIQVNNQDIENNEDFKAKTNKEENNKESNHKSIVPPATVTCLECMGTIKHRMMVQNTSLEVEIDLRRNIKVLDKFRNAKKVQLRDIDTIFQNPDAELDQRVKDESEELRKERKMRDLGDKYQDNGVGSYNRPSMSASYLHDGSDDDDNNISNIKSQFKGDKYKKPVSRPSQPYKPPKKSYASQSTRRPPPSKNRRRESEYIGSDEDRSDEEEEMNDNDKNFIDNDDDEDMDDEDDDDDDDDEDDDEDDKKIAAKFKNKSKRGPDTKKNDKMSTNKSKRSKIIDDDDDDEDEEPEFEDSEEDDDDEEEDDDDEDDDDDEEDEPKTSKNKKSSSSGAQVSKKRDAPEKNVNDNKDDDDEEDIVVAKKRARKSVLESDDED